MNQAQSQEALDGGEFGPAHVFDFLSHMVQVEFVRQIPPCGEVAQNRRLALRPGKDVGIVEIVQGLISCKSRPDCAGRSAARRCALTSL